MALTPRLELRQTQSLVMTPQLQQAIKLLQLSNVELTAYVEQELERNPLLERAETGPDDAPAGPEETSAEPADEGRFAEVNFEEGPGRKDTHAGDLDVDYDNAWTPDAGGEAPAPAESPGGGAEAFADWGRGGGRGFDDGLPDLEATLSRAESLRDHLGQQIALDLDDPTDRVIAAHLVGLLDEAGYLAGDLESVADAMNCDVARVERTLALVQRFDPSGIFARDLAECLALQLRDRDRLDPAMQALLDNLDLLARRDLAGLARTCGVDADDVRDMIAEVRALNPKPASAFDDVVAQPVTPDVLMRPSPDAGWIIELNSETLPRVLVDQHYYAEISRSVRSREEKQYLAECFQTASWLVKSLHQRATTILRVATEIVRQQDAFFAKGVQHLRPLVLRDIADAINMHESTVSRVTSNKYIATPRGIFELKYFFTTAIGHAAGGDAHSAEAVRHRIKALIDAEPAKQVLSDDKIVEILRNEGIDIARRTVAKYREGMRIPSSIQRRREKSVRV